jgi:Fungal protein kinase
MAGRSRSEIIQNNPIGTGLDAFRDAFSSTCQKLSLPTSLDAVDQIGDKCNRHECIVESSLMCTDLKNPTLDLILALQNLPASRLLPSSTGRGTLFGDLSRFSSMIDSEQFNVERVIPLLKGVINNKSDEILFTKVYAAVTESTPPPRPLPYLAQTPHKQTTSSIVNSSEHRKYMDDVLKEELGPLYVGVPGFYDVFFGQISDLKSKADAVFKKCKEGNNPLYSDKDGWRNWPKNAEEKEVLKWLAEQVELFLDFADHHDAGSKTSRRPLAQPDQPLEGSTAERKLDIGFVDDPKASEDSKCHWSQILVPGELKSNLGRDAVTKTWLDLGRYVREVLSAQDTRRFVLGFTLCGSVMRLWEFDRVGGIASAPFDVNKDGLRFVSVVLGYLWMDKEQLGFDPTILKSDGKRYLKISRNDRTECLVLEASIRRATCVAGRATTCWKAYRDGDKSKAPLVIKDSWQYPERDEEGEFLREATERGVVNLARHYHHEIVRVGGIDDDVLVNIRKGLDISKATNYHSQTRKTVSSMISSSTQAPQSSQERGRSTNVPSAIGRKRSSSSINAPLPFSKRPCSSSPTKNVMNPIPLNRVHRRVIVCDFGKHIYQASSRAAMLAALEGCIEGERDCGCLWSVV